VIDGLGDATLLGVIPLALLIKAATQIAELPAVVTRAIAGGQEIRFDWRPTIPEAPPTGPDPLPAPLRRNPSGRLALDLHASLFTPTRLGDAPRTEVQGTLQHVAIGFADVLELRFQRIAFKTVTGQRPEFTVDLKGLTFTGALTFVDKLKEALQKFLGSGLFVNLAPDHLEAGLRVAIPDAPLFGFSVQNIAFSASVLLFLSKQPAAVKFGLCRRDNPFLITYSAFGGGGYFELTANTRGEISVDAGLDFGAVVSLNLFVAKGRAQALAGVGFSLTNTREGNKVELRASLRLSGSLEVLGLVTIAVQFYLELKYDFETKIATGRAAVTVMVRVLAFSKSVTLTVERSFNAREVPLPTPTRTFRETVSLAQWREYCEAFA
jgi:hypothetical protein